MAALVFAGFSGKLNFVSTLFPAAFFAGDGRIRPALRLRPLAKLCGGSYFIGAAAEGSAPPLAGQEPP